MITVPIHVSPEVLRVCRRVVVSPEPLHVPIRAEADALPNECFPNVEAKLARDGGSVLYGWQIWERRRVLIEAEFHAVWCSPAGELLDVTPKTKPFHRIMFCPDPVRRYEGRQINNVRLALSDDPLIHEFIGLFDAYHAEMNRGPLAEMHGMVPISLRAQSIQRRISVLEGRIQEKYLGRNDPCPCNSGKKFKHCHGRSG